MAINKEAFLTEWMLNRVRSGNYQITGRAPDDANNNGHLEQMSNDAASGWLALQRAIVKTGGDASS